MRLAFVAVALVLAACSSNGDDYWQRPTGEMPVRYTIVFAVPAGVEVLLDGEPLETNVDEIDIGGTFVGGNGDPRQWRGIGCLQCVTEGGGPSIICT